MIRNCFVSEGARADTKSGARALFLSNAAEQRVEALDVIPQFASNSASNAIDYAKFCSRSHHAVIRVYDDSGNVIETHEHAGEFKEP